MPTIRDVAKRAGVAPITVSRVINRSGPVSETTRKRVEAAIAELGYMPNRLAPSLRSSVTHLIALLLSDFANPFWVQVMRGVEGAAQRQGYHMILSDLRENEVEQEGLLRSLLERQVDGIILRPASDRAEPVKLIQSQGVPVVVLDFKMADVEVDVVRGDSEKGAYRLTKLLLDLGHRRIAILSGPPQASSATMRVDGYCRALQEFGLEADEELVYHDTFTFEGGYRMAKQALALDPRPTALFAANNRIAFATLRALQDAGLRVPEDISVVGFDELPVETAEHPFLTVAEQSPYEMGRRAAELLIARISGQAPQGYQEIVLPVKVIFRESAGPCTQGQRR